MREIIKAIRITLVLWVITAIIYPLLIIVVAQVAFPYQANGSLIENQGKVIGSALIGQPFTSNQYFWSRPSTVAYSTVDPKGDKNNILKTGISGASNLAPSNKKALIDDRIKPEIDRLKQANIQPTADLVYTSGSGLDPHISVEAAYSQVKRVAQNRSLSLDMVQALIPKYTEGRFLGIFGEPGVNVLKLNLALDNLKSAS
ncbi:MAG TPA: K(+)-transporting ATPase subunit C [Candidatus Sericytochromatia bacterium]